MKKVLFYFFVCLVSFQVFTQEVEIRGVVSDRNTSESLIGASVVYAPGKGVVTDIDGNFTIKVPKGEYELKVSYSGYLEKITKVNAEKKINIVNIKLNTIELDEVEVLGTLGKDRETPVAITQISRKQLTEELASQDLPMVLNGTPGVHATQTGGGDGDARVTIRGFTQRNIAVMIDGVPVNDMENGWVYWSNWFGLDAITQTMQVQRGLGATKIANPAVGGSLNILTKGIDNKFSLRVKQELGSGLYARTSIAYNSGQLKGKWGLTLAGSFKRGDGWVDGTPTLGGFYYAKIQKRFKRHTMSLSAFGAPQKHGQRSYKKRIAYWDKDFANKLGIEEVDAPDHGIRYNEHWGYRTIDGKEKLQNERLNYFHKPQITLKDFWNVNEKISWSNIAYVSIGRGGGTALDNYSAAARDENGQIDFDQIEFSNQNFVFGTDTFPNTDPLYSDSLNKSNQFLRSSINNHFWVGALSTIDYRINDKWKFNAGLDYRYYKGTHYKEAYDLLGGDYVVSNVNQNAPYSTWGEGDKVGDPDKQYRNHRDGLVQWIGAFTQAEFNNKKWTWFVNLSGVYSGYKGIDYFLPKQISLEDTTLQVAYYDTVSYGGKEYTTDSKEAVHNNTGWVWKPGFTFKTGANVNFDKKNNLYINVGYLSRTPQFSNVVNNEGNNVFNEIKNEEIIAAEFGYGFRSKKFSLNFSGYYTYWNNKPFPFGFSIPDPNDPLETLKVNINGMAAQHMGLELDFVYKIIPQLELQGVISMGDWTWRSKDTVNVQGNTVSFDAKGVHVGDAAQSSAALSLRYEFVKGAYIKVRYTLFGRYYSDFDPFTLTGANAGRESWKLPTYGLMDIHLGYSFKFKKKYGLAFRGSLLNVLNTKYISDAKNNGIDSGFSDFDARSADVFFGQGIRWNFSIAFQLF